MFSLIQRIFLRVPFKTNVNHHYSVNTM
jgi:hypothetical protein